MPSRSSTPIPTAPFTFGLLGLIPFVGPPIGVLLRPEFAAPLLGLQAIYAALILSFLGGARWGFAVTQSPPGTLTVSLSMIPTLVALALLFIPPTLMSWKLGGFALALAAHGAWDARPGVGPDWYPRLRSLLSAVACGGLILGAWLAYG